MTETSPPPRAPRKKSAETLHDEQVADLRQGIADLTMLVGQLTMVQAGQLDTQAKQIKKIRLLTIITLVGLMLDMMLTVLGVFVVMRVNNNSNDLRIVQSKVSTDALCPLYDIFLDAYAPKSPQALANPKAYDDAFVVIERGATALGCAHHTRGSG